MDFLSLGNVDPHLYVKIKSKSNESEGRKRDGRSSFLLGDNKLVLCYNRKGSHFRAQREDWNKPNRGAEYEAENDVTNKGK